MPKGWSKGLTKETSSSIRKRSETMIKRGIDNFAKWRQKMRRIGKIPSSYPEFKKDGNLSELIGVILGDGHIMKFPRADELSIFSNSNNSGFVDRYSRLIWVIFKKKPTIARHGDKNCIRIRIYQKEISSRLKIPYSPRGGIKVKIPHWILRKETFIVRYLRGLYEAEGSYCVHLPTYTYKFLFSNKNESMLKNVMYLLQKLGFHPHMSKNNYKVQLSRSYEVKRAIKLLKFRRY